MSLCGELYIHACCTCMHLVYKTDNFFSLVLCRSPPGVALSLGELTDCIRERADAFIAQNNLQASRVTAQVTRSFLRCLIGSFFLVWRRSAPKVALELRRARGGDSRAIRGIYCSRQRPTFSRHSSSFKRAFESAKLLIPHSFREGSEGEGSSYKKALKFICVIIKDLKQYSCPLRHPLFV